MRWIAIVSVLALNAGCGIAAAIGPCSSIADDCTCFSRSDCQMVTEPCWCAAHCGVQTSCLKCANSRFIRCEAK